MLCHVAHWLRTASRRVPEFIWYCQTSLANGLRGIWRNPACEDITQLSGAMERGRKDCERQGEAAMVLVTLWTTREDARQLEVCSAEPRRALAASHLWHPTLDSHEVLGLLQEGRPPRGKLHAKPPKGDRHTLRTAAFAHAVDWLDGEVLHHRNAVGIAARKKQGDAQSPEEGTNPMELFEWWSHHAREPGE